MRRCPVIAFLPLLIAPTLITPLFVSPLFAQTSAPAAKPTIGLVYSVGGLGDASFNDSAHDGLTRAKKELGVETLEFEPGDASQRMPLARRLAAGKADLIFGIGLFFSDDFLALAREFPNRKFAVVDYSGAEEGMPANLLGIRFREQEGAYLVGAIAALLSRTGAVGFVGGMDSPLIRKFEAGYRAGAKAVKPETKVLAAYAGMTGEAFANPPKGKELALAQFDAGADIIFQAAGTTGFGVFKAAEERGRRAVGVDADQSKMAAPRVIVTSMLKVTGETVFQSIRDFAEGRWQGGIREFGLKEGALGYVANESNKDILTPEIRKQVDELEDKIIAGEIKVPSAVE
ncbi:MAG: BMP family ABC transporter substrate-binding protein [Candidatus Sumerlaeota bacterium]|nr:BMP family ABC transporter substrate-binding protein [Candidatus Sumerlaeota bacterium]